MNKKREPAKHISFRMSARVYRAANLYAEYQTKNQSKNIGYQTVTNDHMEAIVDSWVELGLMTEEDLEKD